MTKSAWLAAFPALDKLEGDTRKTLCDAVRVVRLPPGTQVFREGDAASNYLLVLSGAVCVRKTSENGREIVLYRVERGQSCVITTNSLLTREDYSAEAIIESEVEAVALPAATFRTLLATSEPFREFVFSAYATRIGELLMLIEEVAFGRIDARLAQYLLEKNSHEIRATHQEVAVELGTAREVVSRQLKDFEKRGWVDLHRGRIEILQAEALRALSRKCD